MPTELVAYALRLYVVPGVSPVIELEKDPVPGPPEYLLSDVVGVLLVVLQQTPFSIMDAPPSAVTEPLTVAVFEVILEGVSNETIGSVLGSSSMQLKKKKLSVKRAQNENFLFTSFYFKNFNKSSIFLIVCKKYIKKDNQILKNLDSFYQKSNGETKRKILGGIFSENFVLQDKKVAAINYKTPIQVLFNVKREESRKTKKKSN